MFMAPLSNTDFQGWASISRPVSDLLNKQGRHTNITKGTVIFGPDNPAENLLFLICGTVRVEQRIEAGHNFVLYRVHAGASCVLTTACLLAFGCYSTRSIAETHVEAVLIPRSTFDERMTISPRFRAVVFEAYSKRINDLRVAIDKVADKRKGCSVAHKQFEHGDAQNFPFTTYH